MSKKPTMADVRRIAKKHSGSVESDGMGGYEVLAPSGRRWIDAEVQCYVLTLNEYEKHEIPDEIQRCVDLIENGHEPYPD
jgi:hypothetical protein